MDHLVRGRAVDLHLLYSAVTTVSPSASVLRILHRIELSTKMKVEVLLSCGELLALDVQNTLPEEVERISPEKSPQKESIGPIFKSVNAALSGKSLRCLKLIKGGEVLTQRESVEEGDVLFAITEPLAGSPTFPPTTKERPVHEKISFSAPGQLPYIAACKLVVKLASGDTAAGIVQVVSTAQEALREAEAKKARQAAAGSDANRDEGPTEDEEEEEPTAADLEPRLISLIPAELIDNLIEFGFQYHAVVRALLECDLNGDEAVNRIVSSPEASVNAELTEQEIMHFSRRYGLIAVNVSPGGTSKGIKRRGAPVDPQVLLLMDMGFPEEEVVLMLKLADGNAEVAAAALLGDRTALEHLRPAAESTVTPPWYQGLDKMIENRMLEGDDVIHVVERLRTHPEDLAALWKDARYNPVLAFFCQIFTDDF